MDSYDFRSTLTTDGLVAEVAAGTFAFKNKLKALSIKLLWEKLGFFIAETLRMQKACFWSRKMQHAVFECSHTAADAGDGANDALRAQGVLLPNLGSFKVGPVVGESKKKIRVAFSLLEGRYGPVSQERPKFLIGEHASPSMHTHTCACMHAYATVRCCHACL